MKVQTCCSGHTDVEDQTCGLIDAFRRKNASAEEKARLAKPNSRSKSGKDSRTDSSSSTTHTTDFSLVRLGCSGCIPEHCSVGSSAFIILWYRFSLVEVVKKGRRLLPPSWGRNEKGPSIDSACYWVTFHDGRMRRLRKGVYRTLVSVPRRCFRSQSGRGK
jgi:hypothetical protein